MTYRSALTPIRGSGAVHGERADVGSGLLGQDFQIVGLAVLDVCIRAPFVRLCCQLLVSLYV